MGKAITDFLLQAGQGAVGAGMGMLLGGHNDRRQREQQQALQDMQIKGNKEMIDYQKAADLQMWNDTNYSAQMEHLRKAGLNPGLLYGMSGGGGVTTGGGAAGVSGSQAPTGGGEPQAMAGMGIQMGLLQAQKANIEAQTAKTKVETEKTAGVDTKEAETRILDLTQGIENKKALEAMTNVQTKIAQIEESIKGRTEEDTVRAIGWNAGKIMEEMDQAKYTTQISEATWRTKVQIVKTELVGMLLKNTLTKTQTQLTNQEITNKANEIVQKWMQLEQSGINTNVNQQRQVQDAFINDVQKSTQIPVEILREAVDGVLRKGTTITNNKQWNWDINNNY